MIDYPNVTPVFEPIITWNNIAPYRPEQQKHEQLNEATGISNLSSFDLFCLPKGVRAPTDLSHKQAQYGATYISKPSEFAPKHTHPKCVKLTQDSDVDRIASQRVKLLVAKYNSGQASAEILARLEILNQRLLEQAPRVSNEQLEVLEMANSKLAQIRAAREDRTRRLGLSV